MNVRHFIGGSVASSFHGATRSTMDVDIVCELTDANVDPLISTIEADYYISETAMRNAIKRKGCFNLIHLPTSFKVDVFISRGRPFDLTSMARATPQRLGGSLNITIPIATPEDAIISKLEWYRLTNETSERQWDDVSRLRDLLGEKIDCEYLQNSADSVGVGDLLARLMGR